MVDAALAGVGLEALKFLITLAMQEMRKKGMTIEQIEALFVSELAEFKANDPDNIPDV